MLSYYCSYLLMHCLLLEYLKIDEVTGSNPFLYSVTSQQRERIQGVKRKHIMNTMNRLSTRREEDLDTHVSGWPLVVFSSAEQRDLVVCLILPFPNRRSLQYTTTTMIGRE